MFLAALALGVVLQKVTWIEPAMPLGELVPKLGAVIGEPLKASPSMAGVVVLVHVHDIEGAELKSQLAKALDCTWETSGGSQFLARRRAVVAQDSAKEAEELAARVIDECKESLKVELTPATVSAAFKDYLAKKKEPGAQSYQAEHQLEDLSPQRRLIQRTLLAVGQKVLAKVFRANRSVLASPATRRQTELPTNYSQLVTQALREKEAWQATVESLGSNDEGSRTVSMPHAFRADQETLERSRLEILRNDLGQSVMFNLRSGASEGPVQDVLGQWTVRGSDLFQRLVGNSGAASEGKTKIQWSDKAKARLAFLRTWYVAATRGSATEDDDKWLRDPVQEEPLSTFVSEAVHQWADAKKLQLIAELPDALFSLIPVLDQFGEVTLDSLDVLFTDVQAGIVQKTEGDWTSWRPARGDACRTDRALIRDLLGRIASGAAVGLDEGSVFIFETQKHQSFWPTVYLTAIAGMVATPDSTSSYDAYVLWGSLTTGQRAALRKDGQLIVSSLTKEQRQIVEDMVYSQVFDGSQLGESDWTARIAGQQADPTDAFPGGLPPDAFLELKLKVYPRICAYGGTSEKPVLLRAFDRGSASRMMASGAEGVSDWLGGPVKLLGFAVGNTHIADMRIVCGPKLWHTYRLKDGFDKPAGSPVPWEALPAEMRSPPNDLGPGGQ